jgi:Fe2+-dicitrate sensor, membrane component
VRIDGEALFRVRHDEKHPFIVSTFASDIRVLGTTFNVLADEHSRLFETTLKEGQVRVTNLANLTDVHTMTPGEVVSLVDGRLQKSVLQDPASLCWVDGLVNLKADSFEALMARFEKVYGVHIILKASPSIEGLSGELRISEGIEHALKVLQHVVDFQYEHYEGNILIKQPK